MKNIKENLSSNSIFNPDFQDYYDYEEPLPQGPTRPPSRQQPVEYPGDVSVKYLMRLIGAVHIMTWLYANHHCHHQLCQS